MPVRVSRNACVTSPVSPSSESFLSAESVPGAARPHISSSSVTRNTSQLGRSNSHRSSFTSPKPSSSIAALLTPVPPSFERQPKEGLPYEDCAPVVLFSTSTRLEDGFPATIPPVVVLGITDPPHPFTTHDVTEGDWLLFLMNVKTASSSSFAKSFVSGTTSMAKGVSRMAGKYLLVLVSSQHCSE